MPRIQPNAKPDAKSQELLAGVKKMLGGTPNMFTTMAQSPATLGTFVGALVALGDSKLSSGLRAQISLAVAGANGSDYCASAHTTLGKLSTVEEGELAQNLQCKSPNAKTQAALTFARKIVAERGRVSDADVQAVRSAGYSEGEIVDIVTVTAIGIFTNYFNHIAGTEVDFPLIRTVNVAKAA
jgi:uncharacterized peroxidase-related enzyme